MFRETYVRAHPEHGPNVCALVANGLIQLSWELWGYERARTSSCAHDVSYTVHCFLITCTCRQCAVSWVAMRAFNHVTYTFKLGASWHLFSEGRSFFRPWISTLPVYFAGVVSSYSSLEYVETTTSQELNYNVPRKQGMDNFFWKEVGPLTPADPERFWSCIALVAFSLVR